MPAESATLTVRRLRADDLPRLVRMDERLTGRRRQAWYEGKLQRALQDSDVQVSLGAELDGILVGAMLGSLHYGEFGLPEPAAVLDTLLVDRDFTRRGVARAMLGQLVKNLRGLRIERLRTEVSWDERELTAFFAHNGFRPVPRLVLELDVMAAKEPEEASR